jgi:hypothetical protein
MRFRERIHPAQMARTLLGLSLLVWPERILIAAGRKPVSHRWVAVARILGVRHLVEAVAVNVKPLPALAALGSVVDAIHALTAAGFGLLDRRDRRLCWINAGGAAAFALAGAHHARVLGDRRPKEPWAA